MRKNLHHKIMLSLLAGSLALGFIYAPPAFAEDVLIADKSYTAPDGTKGTYNLDADGTNPGTTYGDGDIFLPTDDIGTFTVKAGNGGYIWYGTGGDGGSISLSAIGNAINKGVSITAGIGGNSDYYNTDEYVTGGAGGDVTLTFTNVVNGNITASAGIGGNIEPYINGNLTSGDGGDGGDVKLAFTNVVNGNIDASAGNGGNIEPYINGNLTGGNGGDATLTFKNVVTNSIKLTSGSNGGNNYISTAFKGGSVTFEADTIKASSSNSQLLIRVL